MSRDDPFVLPKGAPARARLRAGAPEATPLERERRTADEAIEAYVRLFTNASGPSRGWRVQLATECERLRCGSTLSEIRFAPRIGEQRVCSKCGTRWPYARLIVDRTHRVAPGPVRDQQLAALTTLHVLIARLPTWQRRILTTYVTWPEEDGRRAQSIAAFAKRRWPWRKHGSAVVAELRRAGEIRFGLGRGAGRIPRDWTHQRIKALVRAGRRSLASSLEIAFEE